MVFLVDASGSVGREDFQKEIDFIANLIHQGLSLWQTHHQVAVLTYATDVTIRYNLNEFQTNADAWNGLGIYFTGGTTNTAEALKDARNDVFKVSAGDRAGVPNVGMLVSDGRSDNALLTWVEAKAVRAENIDMVVVAVSENQRWKELQGIASDPDAANIMKAADFGSLDPLIDDLRDTICNSKSVPSCSVAFGPDETSFRVFRFMLTCSRRG